MIFENGIGKQNFDVIHLSTLKFNSRVNGSANDNSMHHAGIQPNSLKSKNNLQSDRETKSYPKTFLTISRQKDPESALWNSSPQKPGENENELSYT